MDDVNIPSEDEKNIAVANEVCRAFEEASGAVLNRNSERMINALGS
jgi:hypothetical protein